MKLFKILLLAGVAAAVGLAVALVRGQRRRLAQMSDAELRAYIGGRLVGLVSEEQLAPILDAAVAKVRSGRWSSPSAAAVTGTVSYRETETMPASAVVIVTVADASVSDAADAQIGAHVIEQPGTVPVAFSVGFDAADIIDDHSYTVRATISSDDSLLWTTDTAYPVITRGNPLTADLLLVAAPESADQ